MVLSIDTEKRIGQKSTSICEKNQSEIREDFLNIINNIYQNSIAIIILNDKKKNKCFNLKNRLKVRISVLIISRQYCYHDKAFYSFQHTNPIRVLLDFLE